MFNLDDTRPISLKVVRTSGTRSITATYSVIADYGWAEKILCSESYDRDANDIARCIATRLNIPVQLAVETVYAPVASDSV